MPRRVEHPSTRPADWPVISHTVRFGRAAGRCEGCGRPHGQVVKCLPDGRWFDDERGQWFDGSGRPAEWPDIVDFCRFRLTKVVLACCPLDAGGVEPGSLRAYCQRCHLLAAAPRRRERQRVSGLLRRALGDLFEGPYRLDGLRSASL